VNPTLGRCVAFYGLKPQGKKVSDNEERAKETEGEDRTGPDGAPLDEARRNDSSIALPNLYDNESHEEHKPNDEQSNNSRVAPGVLCTTPLSSQKDTYDGRNKHNKAVKIHFLKLFLQRQSSPAVSPRVVIVWNKEENDDSGDHPERQIDVEAQTPGHTLYMTYSALWITQNAEGYTYQ
jgi:hypothetical protein